MMTVERTPRRWWLAAALAVALATGGCATQATTQPQASAQDDVNDPLEPLNRYVFEVNFFLDEFVLKPLAWWYRAALPDPVQNGVNNVLQNMRTPWSFVNDLLQGETDRAGTSAARFGINTTLGVFGIFEVAEGMGFPEHDEDFGQTMAVWGVPEGFYLVLPIFGPSNPRDAIGSVVDDYGDPFNLYTRLRDSNTNFPLYRGIGTGIDRRARNLESVDDLRRTSVDFYAAVRSLYRQNRAKEISNGRRAADAPLPAFPSDDDDTGTAPKQGTKQ